jgi:hypothetical protein
LGDGCLGRQVISCDGGSFEIRVHASGSTVDIVESGMVHTSVIDTAAAVPCLSARASVIAVFFYTHSHTDPVPNNEVVSISGTYQIACDVNNE